MAFSFKELKFHTAKFHKDSDGYSINLNWKPLEKKLQEAQYAVDAQAWQDVQKYMPMDTGALRDETNLLNVQACGTGTIYLYPENHDYGHYLHEGVLYVDPVYNVGAFPITVAGEVVGFYSRPGVPKIPSERKLTYRDPNARAHWGEVAIQNHFKEWEKIALKVANSK